MKKLLLCSVTLFFLLPAAAVYGQSSNATIQNTLGIGPRVGYYKANDAESGNFYFGLQSRIRLGSVLGLEGSVEYRGGQKYDFAGQTMKTKFVPVTASVLLFLPINPNVAPYGVAGLGAYYTIYDYDGPISNGQDNEFNFGYHLGFGVEFPINKHAALNVDYRYLFLNPNEGEANTSGADYSGNVFTAGLMFYL